MKNFWQELPKLFFCLAPMEDVTNVIFRQVITKATRPDVFFTEFMNVSGFVHPEGRVNVARRLQTASTDTPIVAQIWGNRPKDFAKTAIEICKMKSFSGIDINMGCPDKAVIKSGGGSALINNPDLAIEIIQSTKNKSKLPVSVKTRLGYSKVNEWENWLTTLLEQDITALSVHLRTKKEMSKVAAHFELIPEIVALRDKLAPQTKLIINGDIADVAIGTTLVKENPGIDGIMIGRGVFLNPYCFEKNPQAHSQQELISLLKFHLELFIKDSQKSKFLLKYEPLKKFLKIYINNFPGAKELRVELMGTKSAEEALKLL
jgi:tRNA-dihydrouridine synthase